MQPFKDENMPGLHRNLDHVSECVSRDGELMTDCVDSCNVDTYEGSSRITDERPLPQPALQGTFIEAGRREVVGILPVSSDNVVLGYGR